MHRSGRGCLFRLDSLSATLQALVRLGEQLAAAESHFTPRASHDKV